MTNLINARNCSGSSRPSFVSFLRISRWENIFTNQSDVFVCQESLPPRLRYLIFETLCIIAYYDCDYNCCSILPFFFFSLVKCFFTEIVEILNSWNDIGYFKGYSVCSDFAFLPLLFFLPFCEFSSEIFTRFSQNRGNFDSVKLFWLFWKEGAIYTKYYYWNIRNIIIINTMNNKSKCVNQWHLWIVHHDKSFNLSFQE